MKTASLKGEDLYYWVTKADGQEQYSPVLGSAMELSRSKVRAYYQSIVLREHIDIASEAGGYCAAVYRFPENGKWSCHIGRSRHALVAAMRAYVHSWFGAEVEQVCWIPSGNAACCYSGIKESQFTYRNEEY